MIAMGGDLMTIKVLTLAQILVLARVSLMFVEMALIRAGVVRGHFTWRDTLASLVMRAGNYTSYALVAGLTYASFKFFYDHRLFDIPWDSPWTWVSIVVLDDFAYYWFHRWSHEVRFWWAAHVNHHSSQEYNLSTAVRQTWTGAIVGTWAPWFVLAWIGYPIELIFLQSGLNLLYQYWIHTEAIRRLPAWYEYIFNTPSHHRVHHASNPRYVDRNYAGVFMIWDRLFGTFAAERDEEPPKYGLIHNINTYNPIKIAFHEWVAMFRDVKRSRSLREAFMYVFGPPGWRPDGTGPTAANLRAAWLRETAGSAA
jgi:sterol desaturase/sphingolipid hydroxylase (fatty acid hydroxylase superfamily)